MMLISVKVFVTARTILQEAVVMNAHQAFSSITMLTSQILTCAKTAPAIWLVQPELSVKVTVVVFVILDTLEIVAMCALMGSI
jgi:hypothetical protein